MSCESSPDRSEASPVSSPSLPSSSSLPDRLPLPLRPSRRRGPLASSDSSSESSMMARRLAAEGREEPKGGEQVYAVAA